MAEQRGVAGSTRPWQGATPSAAPSTARSSAGLAAPMGQALVGFQQAQAIYVIAKLDIATALLSCPRSVGDLASATGADPGVLRRLLDLVSGLGMFTPQPGDTVAVTPLGATLVDGAPGSVRELAITWMEAHDAPVAELLSTVRTGVPPRRGGPQLPCVEPGRCTLLTRIHASIEQHLGDPRLSPSMIAAVNHISVRYLHKLFHTQQASVAGFIRDARLERCRADLLDPATRSHPVHAIAARWGLTDPAHFNRLFRKTYGLPPADYRRRRLAHHACAHTVGSAHT
ncbi:MAG: helix-turn-helix domain-containing protein [Sciscionella sp.]